jgi:ElaB/YqjD/DUF883 family membrane-anchored ribosome-binding protein
MNSIESKQNGSDKDRLMSDVNAVLSDAEELLHATANQGGEKVTAIRAKMTARLSDAKERFMAAEQQVVEKAKAAAKATDEYVQTNPWQSVLIASGVGFVIGFIVHRMVSPQKS